MSQKVHIKICSGTTCYILGGAELTLLEEVLPDEIKKRITIEGAPCLDLCKETKNGRPPFAILNGEVIAEATCTKIINQIKALDESEQQNEPSQ